MVECHQGFSATGQTGLFATKKFSRVKHLAGSDYAYTDFVDYHC